MSKMLYVSANNSMQGLQRLRTGNCEDSSYSTHTDLAAGTVVTPHEFNRTGFTVV